MKSNVVIVATICLLFTNSSFPMHLFSLSADEITSSKRDRIYFRIDSQMHILESSCYGNMRLHEKSENLVQKNILDVLPLDEKKRGEMINKVVSALNLEQINEMVYAIKEMDEHEKPLVIAAMDEYFRAFCQEKQPKEIYYKAKIIPVKGERFKASSYLVIISWLTSRMIETVK